jgi:hypothetical protein
MTARTEPRSGIKYGWALGESGWNTEMDNDLLLIGRVGVHLSVKNRITTAPPGSPAAGDTYIPAATATGAWAGKEGQIAIWSGTTWVFYVPRKGWRAYIEDEEVISTYKTSWSAGNATNQHAAVSMTSDANKTLSAAEAASGILHVTSTVSLTATRNIVVPLTPRQWTVRNGTTGAQSIQVIGASGAGITIATGKLAIVYSDGTNVVRVTADT